MQCSVHDRYLLLERLFRKKVSEVIKAFGTYIHNPIIWWGRWAKWFQKGGNARRRSEASQAEEMWKTSLETLKQSQERWPKQKKTSKWSRHYDIPERKSWNWISAKVGGTGVKEARTTNLTEEAKEAKLNLRAKEHKEREARTGDCRSIAATTTKYKYGFILEI